MSSKKSLVLLSLLLSSGPLLADADFVGAYDYDTYGGVNYKYNWIKAQGDWQKFFIHNHPGFDFYVGWRFSANMGIEFGYEWTSHKPFQNSIANGETFLGVVNNSGQQEITLARVRFKGGHVDLNGFIPFNLGGLISPEFIVSVGVAAMKPMFTIDIQPDSVFSQNFTNIQSKGKTLYRGGLGLQMRLLEHMGMRVLWRYEQTSTIRGRYSDVTQSIATRKIFRDSQSICVGLTLKF